MHKPLLAAVVSLLLVSPLFAQNGAQDEPDAATRAWWAQTSALANDSMEGRDTGTAAYERAAEYVAEQFRQAGLKPAGENGTYFQRVPMHQVDLDVARSSVEILPQGSGPAVVAGAIGVTRLKLLQQVTVTPSDSLPVSLQGPMVFVGYGTQNAAQLPDLHGKVAVLFNNVPAGTPESHRAALLAGRMEHLRAAGALLVVSIDNPGAIEPTHWPAAYARSVVLAPVHDGAASPMPVMRISSEAAENLFVGSGHAIGDIRRDGEAGAPLASFPLKGVLRLKLVTTSKEITSPNVLAVLPGSDPKLASEYVAVSAHLDGYGYGTPVLGDKLYNGALDDAAYVATLIQLAKDLHGHAPARSLLFCIFTGEEKGLLGSHYFTTHPTVPMGQVVADLNLDQLRPIFPLRILTMEGIDDSTLGETVKAVAAPFHIEIRPDREPSRNLYRRADNYNFVRAGVPIASFIFGYDPGSPEEQIYRDWYARRYHKPQDDLYTPIDWAAAGKFNAFYQKLAVTIADDPKRPAWLPASPNAPKGR